MNNVFYICNRKACGEVCPNKECTHTANVEYRKQGTSGVFTKGVGGDLWEFNYDHGMGDDEGG